MLLFIMEQSIHRMDQKVCRYFKTGPINKNIIQIADNHIEDHFWKPDGSIKWYGKWIQEEWQVIEIIKYVVSKSKSSTNQKQGIPFEFVEYTETQSFEQVIKNSTTLIWTINFKRLGIDSSNTIWSKRDQKTT